MSIDKSLLTKDKLTRHRNVLSRAEQVKYLKSESMWEEGRSVFGLPKVRTFKAKKKAKVEKEKTEESTDSTDVESKEKASK